MKRIPEWKLKKIFKASCTLHKVTVSEIEDEFGMTEETTETTYSIKAEVQPLTSEDLAYLPPGQFSEGDAWAYFLPSYNVNEETLTVEVNDYITFNGIKYLVQRYEDYFEGNNVIYRRAYLKRQVGQ